MSPAARLLAILSLLLPASTPVLAGGPDGAGYRWFGVDAGCPATPPEFGPDANAFDSPGSAVGPLSISSGFLFHGTVKTELFISPTGFVAFSDQGVAGDSPDAQRMPDPLVPNDLIALYWSSSLADAILVEDTGDFFHLRWNSIVLNELQSIDLVLFPDGRFRMFWGSRFDHVVTAGHEGPEGLVGDTWFREGVSLHQDFPSSLDGGSLCFTPPAFLDCSEPATVSCGGSVTSSLPVAGDRFITDWPCHPESLAANEKLVRLTLTDPVAATLVLDDPSLSLLQLDIPPCADEACERGGPAGLEAPVLFSGETWFAVDGDETQDGTPFSLDVACSSLPGLACGATVSGDTTGGVDARRDHACAGALLDGPESYHLVDHPGSGPLAVRLEAADPALWTVIYSEEGACLAAGPGGATFFDAPAGRYLVAVDGEGEAAGPHTLRARCTSILDCAAAVPIACGQTVTADLAPAPAGTADAYPCLEGSHGAGEAVFTFSNPEAQPVGFLLDGPPGASVAVLDSCDEGSCLAGSQGSLSAELPAGQLTVVVDAPEGSSGEIRLRAACDDALTPAALETTLAVGESIDEEKDLFLTSSVPKADILFGIDLTESMSDELTNLRSNALEIVQRLDAEIDDLRVGLVSFEDYPAQFDPAVNCDWLDVAYGVGTDQPYRLDLPLTPDLSAFQQATNDLFLGDGGDAPESYSRVLWESVNDPRIGWRPDARRIFVLFGDSIPHDCDPDACLGPDGRVPFESTGRDPGPDALVDTPDDLRILDVVDEMAVTEDNVALLYIDSSAILVFRELWECLAARTGGNVYALNADGSVPSGIDLPSLVREAVLEETTTCDRLTLDAEPGFEDWLRSVDPPELLEVSLPLAESFTLRLAPPPETPPGDYTFTVNAVCDGEIRASQQVTVHVDCKIQAVAPEEIAACVGETVTLDGSASVALGCGGEVHYRWLRDGALVRDWSPDPVFEEPLPESGGLYRLEVACFDDPACQVEDSDSLAATALPDEVPPAVGSRLRLRREGEDIAFTWSDLAGPPVGGYEVVGLDADLGGTPDADAMDAADLVGAAEPGVEAALHEGATASPCTLGSGSSPCRLLFYQLRATSPCSETPGSTCDAFPGQVPCP